MAQAYIAAKPVRFDRNYCVGERIPEIVIQPSMRKRLVDMGRILCVDLPEGTGEEAPQNGAEMPTDGTEGAGDTDTQPEQESPAEGKPDATEAESGASPQDGAEAEAAEPAEPSATDTNVGRTEDGTAAPSGEPPDEAEPDLPEEPQFVCEVCGKKFKSKNALSAHSRTHKD